MSLADEMAADAASPQQAVTARPLSASMAADTAPPAAPMQAPDPTGSTTENLAAGFGKGLVDVARGAGQISRSVLEKVGRGDVADKLGLPTTADIDESKRLDAPLMKTTAGTAGYIGGNIAATTVPLGVGARVGLPIAGALLNPSTYTAAAASGALSGALQPVGTGESRPLNMLLGAGTGMAGNTAANAVGRIAAPVQNGVDAARQRAVQVLQKAGVPLDAAQLSGGPFLNRLRSSFSDNPFTSGAQADLIGQQKTAFNRAVLNTIGENGDAATQQVMGRAADRINGVFQDVLSRNKVNVTDDLLNRVSAIQQAANDEGRPAVSNLANRLIGHIDDTGAIPGQAAYTVKKDLDRLASSSDTTLAYHARQLRSTLMDGINDSLNTADQQAFSQARQQFRNMKTIESAIDKEGSGNISPAILGNTMSQKANRQASIYGRGNQDLVELGQAGKMLLGDKLPNSGTTARATMQLLAPLGAGVAGGAYDAYSGDYGSAAEKAALAAGGAVFAPRLAQYLINSPASASYLANGVGYQPLRSLMMSPQTNAAVGSVVRRLPGSYVQSLHQ